MMKKLSLLLFQYTIQFQKVIYHLNYLKYNLLELVKLVFINMFATVIITIFVDIVWPRIYLYNVQARLVNRIFVCSRYSDY